MNTLYPLLANSIDYAGLFPPAKLDMQQAVENYAQYVTSKDSWMLGRFIVPVARLGEFEKSVQGMLPSSGNPPWHLSALCRNDLRQEIQRVEEFNKRHALPSSPEQAAIDTLELRASGAKEILKDRDFFFLITRYYEIPSDRDPTDQVAAIAQIASRAKIRTGGISENAFPRPEHIVRFVASCIRYRVPYKATAGLHHAVKGMYKLTYEPNSTSATMFGFLNLFLVGGFLARGMSEDDAVLVLEENEPDAFRFDNNGITWRGHRLEQEDIVRTRQMNMVSFGSCSFVEPLEELKELGMVLNN